MASLVRVSGPLHIYVVASGTATYLGSPDDVPQYDEIYHYRAVMNSISGANIPINETFDGIKLMLKMVLTRYDETAVNALRTAPFAAALGEEAAISRGSLMYGRFTRQIVVQNSFFGTNNAAADDLPGYRFVNCKLAGAVPAPGGTGGNSYGLVFECLPLYDPTTRKFLTFQNDAAIAQYVPN